MKLNKLFSLVVFIFLVFCGSKSFATAEDLARFKKDFINSKIKIGHARLKEIQQKYGEPSEITNTDKKIVYQYGDKELKVEFEKTRYWRKWEYDSFKSPAYTDKINDLRRKLEGKKIAGQNIKIEKFIKDYDPPTEMYPTEEDGAESVYYYGDIRLVFENVFVLKSVTGKRLMPAESPALTSSSANVAPASEAVPAKKKADKTPPEDKMGKPAAPLTEKPSVAK